MKLDIKRALESNSFEPYTGELKRLSTPWGEALDPAAVLSEHPRPTMQRDTWRSLNGSWDYAIRHAVDARMQWGIAGAPLAFDGKIVVPFSPEAALSGVGRQLKPDELLWYRRSFTVPRRGRSDRVILHFEGVDWACAVYVNGKAAGTHVGAYTPFSFDVTELLEKGENELSLCVFDPSDTGTQLRGKQRLERQTMWYTAQSGIWQSVWLEVVPKLSVASYSVNADADAGTLSLEFELAGGDGPVAVELKLGRKTVAKGACESHAGHAHLELEVKEPKLWSPDDPVLYDLAITAGSDEVKGYCAFRTVAVEKDEAGVPRFFLNHKPLFLRGLLNQGYWSDGLLTAPSEEARIFDIQTMKDAGFNLFRLHIKTEAERWYYLCDKLGMLVWQDMPSGGGSYSAWYTAQKPTLFTSSWGGFVDTTAGHKEKLAAGDEAYRQEWLATCAETVRRLAVHPCVVSWVLFNESWGQFDSAKACDMVRGIDESRPVLAVSGWYDQGAGDYLGIHNYFRPPLLVRDVKRRAAGLPERAYVTSEFGGLSWFVPEHSSCPVQYGYATYASIEAWRVALRELLGQMCALEEKGLAGFVYTQVSDVEEETNGLLTYDRRVNKLGEGVDLFGALV